MNFKWWPVLGLVVAASTALTGCGGDSGSSGNASVRVVNETLTHSSIDLLVNASVAATAVGLDKVSGYVSPGSGSLALQINDSGQSTALTTISPTIGSGAHVAVIAYEASGLVKTTIVSEDTAVPASGVAALRILNVSADAGALDVYVTAAGVDLSTVSPIGTLTGSSTVPSDPSTITPGTYEVRITGQGSKTDIRADVKNVVLASQQTGLLVLTPASGGILLNGGFLIQQVDGYVGGRNTTARVRVASGLLGNVPVTAVAAAASGASTSIATNLASPAVTSYTLVDAVGSASGGALTVSVNGVAQTLPVTALPAGSDDTLLLTGSAGAAVVQVLTDDNHLPATTITSTTTVPVKVRLVNGLSGTNASALTWSVNSFFPSTVAPGASVTTLQNVINPTLITAVTALGVSAYPPATNPTGTSLSSNGVYTLFVLGDPAAPFAQLRLDR